MIEGGPNITHEGLILYVDAKNPESYPGSGTIFYDLSGNELNADMTTADMWNTSGSMAIETDDLQFGHSLILEPPSITIGAWVNLDDRSDRHVLITKWLGWSFEINADGRPYLRLSGTSPGDLYSTEYLDWGNWYYIASSFNDSDKFGNIYVNGVNRGSNTRSASINYSQGTFNIPYLGQAYAKGQIASVAIWNRALTGHEVYRNFISTKGRFNL